MMWRDAVIPCPKHGTGAALHWNKRAYCFLCKRYLTVKENDDT